MEDRVKKRLTFHVSSLVDELENFFVPFQKIKIYVEFVLIGSADRGTLPRQITENYLSYGN